MNTSVTSYGYKVLKKELSSEQISKIKKDMIILPYVYDPVKGGQNKDKKFNILSESPKAFYLPRFYGIDNFGSPKKNKLPEGRIYDEAHELKVIIYNKHDLIFAEEQAAKTNANCILYLQPEWSVRDKVVPMIVDYVMNNPKWKVSLQTHKYLNIP